MGKKRKEKKFPHVVPVDYLRSVSDNLHKTNPSEAILYNTVLDVWKEGYNKGYWRKFTEALRFRQKRAAAIKRDFDKFKDNLDDKIHEKSNLNKL